MNKRSLQLRQLESKMQAFSGLESIVMPPTGWIKAIRQAIGMSAQQLGKRLSITRQGVQDMERREQDGSITIKALQETANTLDMKLVYGFVPVDGSLDALIDRKAKALASQIVMRTSGSMRLEDQENKPQRLERAIAERTELLKQEMPKILWN
jgi:predicted DNA-binding mobile mystery protein A